MKKLLEKVKAAGGAARKIRPARGDIHLFFGALQSNGAALAAAVVAAFFVMLLFCVVVFFLAVKGPEEVMVPEVRGKELAAALIEMQGKELYPDITLRYSETPGDEGTILDQLPEAGSIVKGYSRVSLVVSRGVVVDSVGDYVGRNVDEVRLHLQTIFAGSAKPLIVLGEPSYRADVSPAGTIIAQDPPEGTDISKPVVVNVVVSRGPSFENTRVPPLVGKSVMELLQIVSSGRVVFDCAARAPVDGEAPGTVVGQSVAAGEFVRNYSRVGVELALPSGVYNDNLYGIFSASLTVYPYPVPMRLDAVSDDAATTLASFLHPGGSLAVPYAVPRNTTLVLFVNGKEAVKTTVH